ncbi:purine permease 3 [Phtheirospermum japonicum]|uniref:Probable purine permease n=1 Tax=Phtheirospermum japonicum TaxID=374723 RepID=A0A830BD31_9LAMI|nr:purine permease 3 [Phtheirospermum japonicum]
MKRVFLTTSCLLLAIGTCGAPLITRLYFINGGKRKWFSSWLQTGGWPIVLVPLLVAYTRRRRKSARTKIFYMKPRVLAATLGIGTLSGLGDYLYMYGAAQLPVSTSSIILASQLAFTAAFAFLLVKQKFTSHSVNAVILLTVAAVILGIHFLMTAGTTVLFGLMLPLVELTYKKAKQAVTLTLVLEMQLVISFVATAFCTVGMIINNDFQAIAGEAKAYGLGETKYYLVVVWIAIISQFCNLGALGIIFYSSSLLSGIMITVLLPVTEILAVIFYREKFQAEKGVSLFLSLWGFISYFYGEIKHSNTNTTNNDNKQKNMNMKQTSTNTTNSDNKQKNMNMNQTEEEEEIELALQTVGS